MRWRLQPHFHYPFWPAALIAGLARKLSLKMLLLLRCDFREFLACPPRPRTRVASEFLKLLDERLTEQPLLSEFITKSYEIPLKVLVSLVGNWYLGVAFQLQAGLCKIQKRCRVTQVHGFAGGYQGVVLRVIDVKSCLAACMSAFRELTRLL